MNKYEHIIVPESIKRAIKYSPRGSGGGGLSIPMRNRQEHAEYLQRNKLTLSVFVRMSHKCRKQKRIMQLSASWGLLQLQN